MSRVLFAVSGSIAAFKAAQAVSQLVQRGHEVQVVTTPSALNFVGSATWEGLTGRPVLSDVFTSGHQMDHIHLARWADVYLLCPATANVLGQWAQGLASDLPSALFLAFERSKPVYIAPAMNKEMWSHPATQKNLRRLTAWGVRVIEPEDGSLACGETGTGRLASIDRIVAAAEPPPSRGRILVTSGATREPIDRVRFITNVSTGRTGAALTDQFAGAGYEVVYLHGPSSAQPTGSTIERHGYSDFSSLEKSLAQLLRERTFTAVVHAAAVSDFSVAQVAGEDGGGKTGGKLSSNQKLTLHLKRNAKLVLNLKEWSRSKDLKVVAFKLTDTPEIQERLGAVNKLLHRKEIDGVVWNDLNDVGPERHLGSLYEKSGTATQFTNHQEMAALILKLIEREKHHGFDH